MTAAAVAETPPPVAVDTHQLVTDRATRPRPGRGLALPLAAAAALLAVALLVRLALLVRSGWLLEGDDSLSTLMALGVLDGDRPIMLKNQTYASAWEPYAIAASIKLLGISRVAAKLPALLGSLALVGTTWLLAREVAGRAAAWFAAALMAVAPIYVLVLTLKPWAPYTEVMLGGTVALLCATRLAFPRVGQRDARWALGCGVAGGLAFWMHPIAAFYLVPSGVLLLLAVRGRRLATSVGLGCIGFAVGALPVWLYNLQTGGATFQFVGAGSAGQSADRLAVLAAWWNADLPRGVGLWNPWGENARRVEGGLALLYAAAFLWALLARRRPRLRPLDGVLLLLAAIPALFVLSGFGGPALNPWGFDATGRYAPPIWSGLAVVLGACLAAVWRWRRLVGAALLASVLGANVLAWARTDPVLAFQSPYWTKLPVDNGPLLATLRAEQVSAIWLNHWAAFPLMFDSRAIGQDLVAYDWYDVKAGGIDRFPEYRPIVEQAARPAFVLVTDEPVPALVKRLRELNVSFTATRVAPYVVVIPTSRHVHPSEVADALDYRY